MFAKTKSIIRILIRKRCSQNNRNCIKNPNLLKCFTLTAARLNYMTSSLELKDRYSVAANFTCFLSQHHLQYLQFSSSYLPIVYENIQEQC
jgi:hypothetical protein